MTNPNAALKNKNKKFRLFFKILQIGLSMTPLDHHKKTRNAPSVPLVCEQFLLETDQKIQKLPILKKSYSAPTVNPCKKKRKYLQCSHSLPLCTRSLLLKEYRFPNPMELITFYRNQAEYEANLFNQVQNFMDKVMEAEMEVVSYTFTLNRPTDLDHRNTEYKKRALVSLKRAGRNSKSPRKVRGNSGNLNNKEILCIKNNIEFFHIEWEGKASKKLLRFEERLRFLKISRSSFSSIGNSLCSVRFGFWKL